MTAILNQVIRVVKVFVRDTRRERILFESTPSDCIVEIVILQSGVASSRDGNTAKEVANRACVAVDPRVECHYLAGISGRIGRPSLRADATTVARTFAACSVGEIDAAGHAIESPPTPIGKDDQALLDSLQKTLDTVAEKNASGHAVLQQTKFGLALTLAQLPWNTLSLQNIFVALTQFLSDKAARKKR